MDFTSGTPKRSRIKTPIVLAELPSLDNFRTNDSTSSGVYLTHDGVFLLIGRVEPDLPRLLVYSLAVNAHTPIWKFVGSVWLSVI